MTTAFWGTTPILRMLTDVIVLTVIQFTFLWRVVEYWQESINSIQSLIVLVNKLVEVDRQHDFKIIKLTSPYFSPFSYLLHICRNSYFHIICVNAGNVTSLMNNWSERSDSLLFLLQLGLWKSYVNINSPNIWSTPKIIWCLYSSIHKIWWLVISWQLMYSTYFKINRSIHIL